MKVNRILAGRRLTIYPALRFKNTNFMNLDLSFEDREQQQQANQRRLSCKEDISQPKKKNINSNVHTSVSDSQNI